MEYTRGPGIQRKESTMIIRSAPALIAVAALTAFALTTFAQPPKEWGIHDMKRPQPKAIEPGTASDPDGQASALYGQFPHLGNATRAAGGWQTYNIIFHAPRFGADGALQRPARATVILNGVLVQDDQELTGPTAHKARPPYKAHAAKLPLGLQDHGDPVRFRNVWVLELGEGR